MNNSDYIDYHPSYAPMEGDQQHTMQQQPRYAGGGNRGGNYPRQNPGQGGGNMPRHQHSNQPNTQGQVQPAQPVQNVPIRAHVQQTPFVYPGQPVQVLFPGQHVYRYQQAQVYQAGQYPPAGQQFSVTQQQQQQQQQIIQHYAAFGGYPPNAIFYPPQPAPPQNQIHHTQPQFYQQQIPTAGMQHFVRSVASTALPVSQNQPQQQLTAHTHPVTGPQTQLVPTQQSGVISVMPQAVMQQSLATHATTMPPQEHREPPPRRARNILNIVDPTTGEAVIKEANGQAPVPSASPQPTAEPVGVPYESYAEPEGTFDDFQQRSILNHEEVLAPGHPAARSDGEQKNKAKSDFYQRITAVADDTLSGSTSTPEVTRAQPKPLSQSTPTVPLATVCSEVPAAFVHSHVPPPTQPKTTKPASLPVIDTENVNKSNLSSSQLPKEQPPQPTSVPPPVTTTDVEVKPSPTLKSETEASPPSIPTMAVEPEPTKTEESRFVPPVMIDEDKNNAELPATPPSGGRGDEFLDLSMASISPEPIEKYIEITPEKIPVPPKQHTESGEPTIVAKDSDAVDPVKLEDSLSTPIRPNVPNSPDEEISKVEKGIEELQITAVEPAQVVVVEPTFTNGGNEIDEGISGDEDMEEGELQDGYAESDETGEPTRKDRIVYDRDSLMKFKPVGGKDLAQGMDSIPPELIRDGNAPFMGQMTRSQSGGGNYGGGGGYGRNPQQGRMGGNNAGPFHNRMGRMGGQGNWDIRGGPFQIPPPAPGQNRPPVQITLKPPELHQQEPGKAWKPGKNIDDTKDKEQILIEELKKRTRGILNKLTPENFDKLLEKFLALKFEEGKDLDKQSDADRVAAEAVTAERIGAVISVVFEKAIDEPNFSTAYAKMVQRVQSDASRAISKIFRKKILDQCQKEFQQGNSIEDEVKLLEVKLEEIEEDKKALLKLEIEDKKFNARRRSLGNVRFIGELYKLQILASKILVECVDMLISNGDEESLECLCKLLTTVGKELEWNLSEISIKASQNTKPSMPGKFTADPSYMKNTFTKLKELSDDKRLSSRIRFALLDVFELRLSGWTPRRDANVPKTIQEVHLAAKKEQEDQKEQLMNLPPAPLPPRGGMMPPQQKKGEWNTVDSKKSSRFSTQKPKSDSGSGDLPKFAPGGGSGWVQSARGGGSGSAFSVRPSLPPRFSNFRESDGPPSTPSRDEIVQDLPSARTPSSQSSRESSRSQTPTRENNTGSPRMGPPVRKTPPPTNLQPQPPPQQPQPPPTTPPEQIKEFDVKDAVKQIFIEFCSEKKLDVDWIEKRFPGKRVLTFVDELARQVCDMSKEEQQKTAGGLVKELIKKDRITKAQIIESLKDGVLMELPDLEVDVPKVAAYFAMFLSEVFIDEEDLGWLIPMGEKMVEYEFAETWTNVVSNVLSTLKIRRTEEAVQTLYKNTSGANRLPIQDSDSWIYGETVESIVEKLKKVLRNAKEETVLSSVLQENSFDMRQELVVKGVTESICIVCWSEENGTWNGAKLQRFFSQLPRQKNTKHFPLIWNHVKDFMKRQNVNSDQEEVIWAILSPLEITPLENDK